MVEVESSIRDRSLDSLDGPELRKAKQHGMSDAQIAYLTGTLEGDVRASKARPRRDGLPSRRSTPARPSSSRPRRTTTRRTKRRTRSHPSDRKKAMILGAGPNRIGQGIEFDYCCVHAAYALAEAGLRDHHGELQPGDGLHRLRHLGQPLLRAAHLRGRHGHHRGRAARRRARDLRRADAAQARARARAGGRADPRHEARGDRPRRGPAAVLGGARPARDRVSGSRHRAHARGGRRGRRAHRLPAARAAELRARRARHGDRVRRGVPAALRAEGHARSRPTIPCCSTASSRAPSRSTWTRCATARRVYIGGVMEHIEEAGIHSGDSACCIPPFSLGEETVERDHASTHARSRSRSACADS